TLTVEAAPLHTKPGRYPSELLPATLHLTYTWKADEGEWGAYWAVKGHRRLLSGRWSEKPIVSVGSCDLAEVPGWIGEAVYEFRPSVDLGRAAEIAADMADGPACRVCGCTENAPCEGGCQWVPDPHGGD